MIVLCSIRHLSAGPRPRRPGRAGRVHRGDHLIDIDLAVRKARAWKIPPTTDYRLTGLVDKEARLRTFRDLILVSDTGRLTGTGVRGVVSRGQMPQFIYHVLD